MKVNEIILTQNQINEITNHINMYRSKHHSNNLSYDSKISKVSQDWANYLIQRNTLQHSSNRQYGENLAYFGGMKNEIVILIKKAIDSWYNEILLYDFKKAAFNPQTGHATLLLWRSTTTFGIGYSYNNSNRTAIIVANFNPPGNVTNQFSQNVFSI